MLLYHSTEEKTVKEHNFFEILDHKALLYSISRLGVWCNQVEADDCKYDQALGFGGTLLKAYEAHGKSHLLQLIANSTVPELEPADPINPIRSGILLNNILEELVTGQQLDLENKALAAMYQWHLQECTTAQIKSLLETDTVLPMLLFLGLKSYKNARETMFLRQLIKPIMDRKR